MVTKDFLTFIEYLDLAKLKYNRQGFENDIHYRMVIYNRHNVKYAWYCKENKLIDERAKYDAQKAEFERRLRDYKEK